MPPPAIAKDDVIEEPVSVRAARWLLQAQGRYRALRTRSATPTAISGCEPSVRHAARLFKTGKTQVGAHYKSLKERGVPAGGAHSVGRPRSLDDEEDRAIDGYVQWLINSGSFAGKDLVEHAANQLRSRRGLGPVSKNWYQRWKGDRSWLTASTIKPVEAKRMSAEQRYESTAKFFTLLEKAMSEYNIISSSC